MLKKITKSEKGISLIEVLVALALLGIIAVGFLMAVNTTAKAVFITDERATAESIARSQLESIRQQEYEEAVSSEAEYVKIDLDGKPEYKNYSIKSVTSSGSEAFEDLADEIIAVPWDSANNIAAPGDVGLQRIKLFILHHGKVVITIEGYKVDEIVYIGG